MWHTVTVKNGKNEIINEINTFTSLTEAEQYCDNMNAIAMLKKIAIFYEVN